MSRLMRSAALVALAAAVCLPAFATGKVVTVSPGEVGRPSIEGRCPTFSWSAVPGAESYELVVYEFSEEPLVMGGGPALSRVLPGGALSWTPGRGDCLAAGTKYAWFVRAVAPGLDVGWSEERLFATEVGLNEQHAAEALAVLQEYLADGGELEDLVASERAVEAPLAVPSVGEAASAAAPATGRAPSKEEQAAGLIGTVAVPSAPIPLKELGVNSITSTPNRVVGGDAIAVRGEYTSSDDPEDTVVGYLGVAVSDTRNGEFDGYAVLSGLSHAEIGVLGFSKNSTWDNFGVVGVGRGLAPGGRFHNASARGAVSNQVDLGTSTHAVKALGPVSWNCPANMDRAGTWCINNAVYVAESAGQSIARCHDEGKILCPLEAIMTCDQMNIKKETNNSCGHQTDTAGVVLRTFGVDGTPNQDAFADLITYAADGNLLSKSTVALPYFCCKPVSP